jgi:uncharacterized protein (DUF2141 family)
MKKFNIYLAIFVSFMALSSFVLLQNEVGAIRVDVYGFANDNGKARLLLFNNKQKKYFPSEDKYAYIRLLQTIKNGKATFYLKDIPYGDYAISVHHDEDNNGEVNTNWIGIPNEGLGASNDAKGSFGPPSFDDAKIILNSKDKIVKINIVN